MKAQKLPSGSYRVQLMFNGKSYSFTAASEDEAIYQAVLFKTGRAKEKKHSPTLGECIDKYIANKSNILSPSTLDGYRRIKNNHLVPLLDVKIADLTSERIQALVNQISLNHSPKTTRNAHGFLIAVLNVYAPDMRIRTTLPKPIKHIKQLPPVEDVLEAIVGTDIELPCLLAMWCSLRMSEIRGAKKADITDGVLTVRDTIITVDGQHIEKHSTKTIESTRQIKLPDHIQRLISALPAEQKYLCTLSGQALYKRFSRLLEHKGIAHMTFHDLRHLNASIMLALGIPDKYAMERGGWSSPHIMKEVYQHTFSAERKAADDKIDDYFNALLHTNFHTE